MSVHALKLAETGDRSLKFPAYGALVIATLHVGLALRISSKRLNAAKKGDPSLLEADEFRVALRCQSNHSEYSGIMVAMLLYLQWNADKTKQLSPLGKWSSILATLGSVAFVAGYNVLPDITHTNVIKSGGAAIRYFGFAGLIASVVQTAIKQ
ncbi:hypothetical protein RFI_06867 [Reticulomyxa filosa]|uniref:Uncharacterized protein n=1 Tax=Reticulomyxa filosa TaxID=46433 RepID=X6NVB5_RETFI|nr:hypothetical protein RFI_06867 [Reticulomyxa filosa]|eukprot:ETO30250.1 hypothetical protein RFI_06867 [Reticulomyxa filosa]